MSDTEPAAGAPKADIDVTNAWQASQDQKGKAKKLRLMAGGSWFVAIATEIAAIVLVLRKTFNEGGLALLIGLFVVIAVFAIAGSIMWKKANRHDPASKSEPAKFFIQNQLGAIVTIIAFLPLLALVFLDKDMDPKTKKVAGSVGAALALFATVVFGVDYNPASTEQYTQDMNECAAQIKAKQPTTACSPAVAEQAQAIADDTEAVADATKSAANPDGLDVVYWIAPKDGATKSSSKLVFHLCEDVSTLRGKTVNSGSVTEAYSQNAVRLTKQIAMEQRQCGFTSAE
jgi:ABC-type multidrug transport system fused ATPase/permease subunit